MAGVFSPVFLSLPNNNVHLDPANLDTAVVAHGVLMSHWRSLPCPVGRVDIADQRRPHPDHEGCINGFLFTLGGTIRALFVGNSKEKRRAEFGFLDASVGQVTVPRFYDGTNQPIMLAPADRLMFEDVNVTVVRSESAQASGAGTDRVSWPIVSVLDLVDSRGNRYAQGNDFSIVNGKIVWANKRPVADPATGLPAVYAIRYLMQPSWFVSHLIHELRVGQTPANTIRLPQTAMVVREHVFAAKQSDPEGKGDPARMENQPSDGQLGPRGR